MNPQGVKIRLRTIAVIAIATTCVVFVMQIAGCSSGSGTVEKIEHEISHSVAELFTPEKVWIAPDTSTIPGNDEGKLIRYGRRLMIHTSSYFGPGGSLSKSTNGINCQSCHLDAGTRPYGNNLAVASLTYPRYLARSNDTVTLAQKVNECFSRSLNGTPIDTSSHEMRAYVAYINWLGKDIKKGETPAGTGPIHAPPFIDRPADPERGRLVYEQHCTRCHGADGHGQLSADVLKDASKQLGGTATAEDLYYYPPVWGENSFNGVATLYRLSKFAGFVQHNMPYPLNYTNYILTDEQAWDVAAYANSRHRPIKDFSHDYASDISKKPYDFPFPPYADTLTEAQHKFGPYTGMASAKKKH